MCRYVKCGHLGCVFQLTWLNRLTLKDILFDGTATSRRQRQAKRGKQRWRRPVTTSLFLAIMLLLLSGGMHTNAGLTVYPCLNNLILCFFTYACCESNGLVHTFLYFCNTCELLTQAGIVITFVVMIARSCCVHAHYSVVFWLPFYR